MLSIFFGYVFVMFHINLYRLDLLPDFVGYIFMISGFDAIEDESTDFRLAKKLSMLMLAFTFVHTTLKYTQLMLGTSDWFNSVSSFALSFIAIIAFLGISWYLAKGIEDMEVTHRKKLGAKGLKRIVVLMIISSLSVKFLMGIPTELTHITGEFLYFVTMATNVVFLIQFYRTKKLMDKNDGKKITRYEIVYTDETKQH